jgi:hypothetical protein
MQRARNGRIGIPTILVAVVISTAVLAFAPRHAYACECSVESPRAMLARADAAFIGELIELPTEAIDRSDGYYVFRVEESVKGNLPEQIRVRSALEPESCGLNLLVGARVGLFLHRSDDGDWTSSSCSRVNPDELLAAAKPLPEPDGDGPIAALVGVSAQGLRTIALDAEGRTLAYGAGEGRVKAYAACPKSRTVVEFASAIHNNRRVSLLAVRDLRGFHVVREIDDPLLPIRVTALACLDPEGEEILVFSPWDSVGSEPARLLRVTGTDVEVVREFREQIECSDEGVALDGSNGLVYFNGGPDCRGVYRYDLSDDRLDEITRIPDDILVYQVTDLSLNSDGRYLAVEGRHNARIFRILMVDLAASSIEIVEEGFGDAFERHANLWLPGNRYLLAGTTQARDTALILSPTLEQVGSVEGLPGGLAVARGDAIYLVDAEGRLWTALAGGGTARELREFDDPAVEALIAIDAPVTYDPDAARPDNLAIGAPAPPASIDESTGTTEGTWIVGIGVLALVVGMGIILLGRSTRRRRLARLDDSPKGAAPPQ